MQAASAMNCCRAAGAPFTDITAAVHCHVEHDSPSFTPAERPLSAVRGLHTGSSQEARRGIVFTIPQGKWLFVTGLPYVLEGIFIVYRIMESS